MMKVSSVKRRVATAHRSWFTVTIFGLAVLSGLGRPGLAQVQRRVEGVIRNEAGGSVEGAVVALSDGRGNSRSARTDRDGHYQIAVQGVGQLTLTINARGFEAVKRNISVEAAEVSTLDVTLRVAITDHVEVTAKPLEPGQIISTLTLSGRSLMALPEDPESLLQTLRMLAGSTGTRADQVAFYVDGLPLDRRLPPKSIIQSIRINSDSISAEFSEPGPSRVEIITKPASGDFYGDLRFDFNDSVLNAQTPFEPTKPDVQLQTYLGYIGGPIITNRLGVLGYAGRWDQQENAVVNATTINATTLQPETVHQNVAAPTDTRAYSLKMDGLVGAHHTVSFELSQDQQKRLNAGLQEGFDLPERAFSSSMLERAGTVRVTSAFSDNSLNELRIRRSRREVNDQAGSSAPAILVLEAFNGGGNQDNLSRANTTDELVVSDVATVTRAQHALRIGGSLDVSRVAVTDRSNFGGSFTFGSDVMRDALGRPVVGPGGQFTVISPLQLYSNVLGSVPGYAPSQFAIVRGDPSVTFSPYQAAGFVQDDWRLSPRATLSLGLRSEIQRDVATHVNVAPRAGAAWGLSSRSTLRASLGVFYSAVPTTVISDVNRLDGEHSVQLVVDQPAFFLDVPAAPPQARTIVMIRRAAPDLTTPSSFISTVRFDQEIAPRVFGSIAYSWRRGLNLLRTTATDAPILDFESSGSSRAHEIRATANANIGAGLSLFGSYVWTRAQQDTDGPYTAPANSLDLAAEWGPAPLPVHQATAGGSISLPLGFTASPFFRYSSSLPFNITTGSDNNGDTLFTDRPAFASPGTPGAITTPYGTFTLTPAPGAQLVPRNFGVGGTEFTVDLVVARSFDPRIIDGHATLFITINNLTNHTNYLPFNGVLTSPYFGAANGAQNARRITLSLRYEF